MKTPQPADQPIIIAIDGGAGTGTSTVAKAVAAELGIAHLNTGELYRGITYAVLQAGINPADEAACVEIAKTIEFGLDAGNVTRVNHQDVRGKLHLEDVNSQVSLVSSYPELRNEIVEFQRDFGRTNGVVMEGRDIGTRIFPDAAFKFFFVCDPAERVRRVNAGGRSHETVESLLARDASDATKKVGTFKQAEDAVVIDTTYVSAAEVTKQIVNTVYAQTGKRRTSAPAS